MSPRMQRRNVEMRPPELTAERLLSFTCFLRAASENPHLVTSSDKCSSVRCMARADNWFIISLGKAGEDNEWNSEEQAGRRTAQYSLFDTGITLRFDGNVAVLVNSRIRTSHYTNTRKRISMLLCYTNLTSTENSLVE
jgi:hypothetical protein